MVAAVAEGNAGNAGSRLTGFGGAPRGDREMGLRYLGFDELQSARAYRFDLVAKGDQTRRFVVTVDLALFGAHRVAIQEGPALCARKLAADLEKDVQGEHELTAEDLRAYANARATEEARRAAARKAGGRRSKGSPTDSQSPWRNSRI
jgi:hypothetical protein